jgi:ABC-2 type transport system permease protein
MIDEIKNADRELVTLLSSSSSSWLKTDTDIQPNFNLYPELGFPQGEVQASYPLAVSVQGVFESYFKDVTSPLKSAGETQTTVPTIGSSPETARLVAIGSAEFLDDFVFRLSSNLGGDRYLNSLQFMQNVVDWSVEDLDLLNIRTRGTYARVLKPMTEGEQTMWEGLNYAVALLALIGFAVNWSFRRRNERPMELVEMKKSSPTMGLDERD